MADFQDYQAAFTAHIRQPAEYTKPAGVNSKRMRVYREIVFNNFLASVSACFPVLLGIVGKRRFSQLVRQCFFLQPFKSPLFQDIPRSFVDFLQSLAFSELGLPDYTAQLAHYEWIELVLSRQIDENAFIDSNIAVDTANTLLHLTVTLPAVHQLLRYDFPVHQLSQKSKHLAPEATFLLVYRTSDFQIRFIQLNAVTYQLLLQLKTAHCLLLSHLQTLASQLSEHPETVIIQYGLATIHQLYNQQAIIIDPNQHE